MQSNTVREAALQHMASNKVKAAAAVLEKHLIENERSSDRETPQYSIDTFEMEVALRKGMETLEYLREVRANTEESHIKAVASSSVNREFREQSSWWLPKKELPDSWFPPPPAAVPNKLNSGPRTPRPVSPKHPPPSTPTTVMNPRASPSSKQLRALGLTEEDVAVALGELVPGALQSAAVAGDLSPRRLAHSSSNSNLNSANRGTRASLSGGSTRSLVSSSGGGGGGGPTAPSAAATAASTRVAWALRRGLSNNGSDKPALYDGGGDDAVPGVGPVGPMQPPPGYSRYTLNLFEKQRQSESTVAPTLKQSSSIASSADLSPRPPGNWHRQHHQQQGRPGDLLVIQSDDEAEEEERDGSASDGDGDGDSSARETNSRGGSGGSDVSGNGSGGGLGLGTGFRALAEEEPHSGFKHVALTTAINSAAARVAASNAEAKGGGRNFGMVGSVGGAAPSGAPSPPAPLPPEPQPRTPRSNSARVRQRQQALGSTAPGGPAPAAAVRPESSSPYDSVGGLEYGLLSSRQSSPLVSGLRPSGTAMGGAVSSHRNSSPGVVEAAATPRGVSPLSGAAGVAELSSLALSAAPSLTGVGISGTAVGLVPTPPPPPFSTLESKTSSSSFRLGRPQPPHRSVLHSESARGSAPASPQSTRVALSGFSGRLRLGTTSASGLPPDGAGGDASPGSSAGTPTAGAAALRARLRGLAVPGATVEEDGSLSTRTSNPGAGGPGSAPFARSLLAPPSPAGSGPGGLMESPFHGSQLQSSSRFSERSLLAGGGSATSLDSPAGAMGGIAVVAEDAAAAAAAFGGDGNGAISPAADTPAVMVATPPPLTTTLSRTASRRRIGLRSSLTGDAPPSQDSPPPSRPLPPPPLNLHQSSPTAASAAETSPVASPPSAPAAAAADATAGPRPYSTIPPSSQTAIRASLSLAARRPSNSGSRASPLSGTSGATPSPSPLQPEPQEVPLLDATARGLAAGESATPSAHSAPLPLVTLPTATSAKQPQPQGPPQLKRLPSRSFDSSVPPSLATDTIQEGSDEFSSTADEDSDGPPRRAIGSGGGVPFTPVPQSPVGPLAATRGGSAAALLPSPRPTSAHASGSSPLAPFGRRQQAASTPAAMELVAATAAAAATERDLPPCPVVPAGRARRSSMPSGQSDPSLAAGIGRLGQPQGRTTQPGAAGESPRPWEAPALSPRPSRGAGGSLSVSGGLGSGSAGGGHSTSISGALGGGAALAPTGLLPGRSPAGALAAAAGSSPNTRSASVSGGLPAAQQGTVLRSAPGVSMPGGAGRGRRLSHTGGAQEDAPGSPMNGPEYRLTVGPMPVVAKKVEASFFKQTLDI